MQNRHLNKEKYFEEQSYSTLRHVVPYLKPFFSPGLGKRILEIGCGEGGNLRPFLDAGCLVTGVDLSGSKISNGLKFYENHPRKENLRLICDDIYNLSDTDQPYDLIFMRDVIEHIHDQEKFMHFVKRFLAPAGFFFLAFPPWHNPFGGHQQICSNRILSKLPWIHLLPQKWYASILRLGGEPEVRIDSLLEIRQTGLSIERFESILRAEQYDVIKRSLYLINPNYEVKFQLKAREIPSWLSNIPGIRNFYITTAYYLLRRKSTR
jgi:SAM-dependent methyltransferase